MAKLRVEPGANYYKAGQPRVVWTVERIRDNTVPPHAVLARLDDPTTRITIALTALSNPSYFHRTAAAEREDRARAAAHEQP